MFTHINSCLFFIENSFLNINLFSDTAKKYAKITGVALAIFSSLIALRIICRHFKAHKINQDNSPSPSYLNPLNKLNQQSTSKETPSFKKKDDFIVLEDPIVEKKSEEIVKEAYTDWANQMWNRIDLDDLFN